MPRAKSPPMSSTTAMPPPLSPRTPRKKRRGDRIYSFEHLHREGFAYLADNSHIKTGYRLHYSVRECLLSVFHLHNETFNVWTHLVGALIFVTLVVYLALSNNLLAARPSAPSAVVVAKPQGAAPWCTLGSASLLEQGRHSRSMLLVAALSERSPYVRSMMDTSALPPAAAAAALLREIPTLEMLYARLGENVGNLSHGVATQIAMMQKELSLLRATLGQVADGAQIPTLVENLVQRAEHFSKVINVGANQTLQYAVGEFNGLVDRMMQSLGLFSNADAHEVGHWPIFVFLSCAIICLASSATFHLMYVYSRSFYNILSRLDYAGISLLIAGSFYPIIYYSFYCHPTIVKVYLTVITSMALFTFVFSLVPKFSTPRFIFIRTGIFLALGFFALVPITHLVIQYGLFDPHVTVPIGLLVLMGALYTFGAIIYATKFPERLSPGRFDVFFSSHQLWHLFVVAAALVHYVNAIQHYEWRWNTQCDG